MKRLTHIALLSASLAGLALSAAAAEQRIATLDLKRVFEGYYKTIQSNIAINQEAAEDDKELSQMADNERKHEDEWRQLIDKANDQAVSAEERDKSKKDASDKYAELANDKDYMVKFKREAATRLHEKERQRRDDIVKEIQGIVTAHAKTAGYSMVLDVSGESANLAPVVLYTDGKDDMTDAILKELNIGAPPGSLDTNAPASSSATNLLRGPSP